MNWSSFEAFLEMGGYGLYVWGSYVVTFVLILAEILLLGLRKRDIAAQLDRSGRMRRGS